MGHVQVQTIDQTNRHERPADGRLKGLLVRVATAAALVPLTMAIVVWGGRAYSAVIAFMLILLLFEWTRIVDRAEFSRGFYVLSAAAIGAAFLASGGQFMAAIAVALGGGAVATLIEMRQHQVVPWALAGSIYLILPAIAALYVRHVPADGLLLTLIVFTTVWATDSGAYLVGTFVGGPKLWPRLSPKKTWSGALGGVVAGAGMAVLIGRAVSFEMSILGLLIVGLTIGIAAVVGDLIESGLKRAFDVKDTGAAFPGHGGVLDRLDGFIVAVSVLAIMAASGLIDRL